MRAVEQPVEVGVAAGVAAEEAMVAEEPEVAGLRRGLVGRLGDVVGVGQPVLRLGAARAPRASPRAPRSRRDTSARSSRSFVVVGRRPSPRAGRGRRGRAPPPRAREVDVEDRDGRLAAADGELDAEVAVDDVAGARLTMTCWTQPTWSRTPREGLLLGLRMDAPVRRVGEQLVRRLARRSPRSCFATLRARWYPSSTSGVSRHVGALARPRWALARSRGGPPGRD